MHVVSPAENTTEALLLVALLREPKVDPVVHVSEEEHVVELTHQVELGEEAGSATYENGHCRAKRKREREANHRRFPPHSRS